jgi:hypothetical protein
MQDASPATEAALKQGAGIFWLSALAHMVFSASQGDQKWDIPAIVLQTGFSIALLIL